MKHLVALILLAFVAAAAEPEQADVRGAAEDLLPTAIPKQIHYTKPNIADARSARNKLIEEYQQNSKGGLGTQPILVCHRTWERIDGLGLIKPEIGVKLTAISPEGKVVEGRGYREEAEIGVVWKYLRDQLASKADTQVRTPTEDELANYWSQIGWDIEDSPLFVVERGKKRYFFAFRKDVPFQVCDMSLPGAEPDPKTKGQSGPRD